MRIIALKVFNLFAVIIPLIGFSYSAGAAPAPNAEDPPAAELYFERPSSPTSAPKISGMKLRLTLREAVTLALTRNFEILIEAHNPRIREMELTERESAFDLAVTAEIQSRKAKTDTASGLFTGGSQQVTSEQTLNAGLEKRTATGADISLVFEVVRENSNSRQKVINPDHDTNLTFTLSQPLLKNFGVDVNTADIRIASLTLDQSLLTYRDRVVSVIDSVEQAYWDLVLAISNLKFRKKSLELAKDLRRRNRIQVEVGTLAPIEILEAEATVAARGEDVIVAERQVKDRDDALKKLINVSDSALSWEIQIFPNDKPVFSPVKVDGMAATMQALGRRADLESARLEIEKGKVSIKRERQNLMPELNLEASASNQGVGGNFGDAIDRQSGNKGYTFSGGLTFRYPIGNRDAKAKFEKARLELQRASATFAQLEQSIIEEVRRGVRQVRTDNKRIEATRLARRLAEERLDSQEKKFRVGLSTSRDVLEDQESVANAQTNEVQALVDYNKSVAQLGRVTYSTLQRFRIKLGDPRKGTRP